MQPEPLAVASLRPARRRSWLGPLLAAGSTRPSCGPRPSGARVRTADPPRRRTQPRRRQQPDLGEQAHAFATSDHRRRAALLRRRAARSGARVIVCDRFGGRRPDREIGGMPGSYGRAAL